LLVAPLPLNVQSGFIAALTKVAEVEKMMSMVADALGLRRLPSTTKMGYKPYSAH